MSYILITGASKGIGRAMAEHILKDSDHNLILHASRDSSFDKLRSELDPECLERVVFKTADFTNMDSVSSFAKEVRKSYGKELYAVINNAGYNVNKPLTMMKQEDIESVINVNMLAPMILMKLLIKSFQRNNEGVIINVSSIVGSTGNAMQIPYAATKAAMDNLTKSLAIELKVFGATGVRVVAIAPGFIETEMTGVLSEEILSGYLDKIAVGRFGNVGDIASLVNFLLSEKSAFINGTTIHIDGGMFS